jgi:signal transduction histidine kinase
MDPRRIALESDHISVDGLRPAALALTVLCLGLFGLCLLWVTHRCALTARRVHALGALCTLGILAVIVLGGLFGAFSGSVFTLYVGMMIVVAVGSLTSLSWALFVGFAYLAAWAFVATRVMRDGWAECLAVVVSSYAAAFVAHATRRASRRRILELRRGDAARETALERALDDAQEARRELDAKVEQRTSALREELKQRQRLEQELQHAQKMEAVGRLAGGVAHDFNNLLAVIGLSLQMLDDPGLGPAEKGETLRDARDATQRATELTRDLLAFGRKQTLKRGTLVVADVLAGVERMIRRLAGGGIEVSLRTADDTGEILADVNQIEQVMLNLAINACHAMGDQGSLTVRAAPVSLDAAAAAALRVGPGEFVRIEVTDTGSGMSESTRASVFEPFFTTKGQGRGTGLGLAVAHGIVTQHGGAIDVTSELGRGSTFTVLLPRISRTPSQPSMPVAAEVSSSRSRGNETLLLVEDEPALRRVVQRTLERLGYRVVSAESGEHALRVADTLPGIDLLVSDVVMPGFDGPELASRLRKRWPQLRVLFLTGYGRDKLSRSDAVGPDDRVLLKPYPVPELARILRAMLDGQRPSLRPPDVRLLETA